MREGEWQSHRQPLHAHPDANAGPVAHAATVSQPDACRHADADADADANPKADSDANPEANANANPEADPDTDAEGDPEADPDACAEAEPDAEGDARGQSDSIPDTRARYHRHPIARRVPGRDNRRRAAAHRRSRRPR